MSAAAAPWALGPPVQLAYAVDDVEAAAAAWASTTGAGPFFVRHHIALVDVEYRGRPATFDHSSAYGQWGAVMVELVQDHTDGPSVVHDRFPVGGGGLHHLAFMVDDLVQTERELVARGHQVAMRASTPGGTAFRFMDALATHGHFVELYPRSARLTAFYGAVGDAAVGWDGSDPVRFGDPGR